MKQNTVTEQHIKNLIELSHVVVNEVFGKCTIVSLKLPNGFILTESSACVDPENYDMQVGKEICLNRIENRIWELEGYLLQDKKSHIKAEDVRKAWDNVGIVKLADTIPLIVEGGPCKPIPRTCPITGDPLAQLFKE